MRNSVPSGADMLFRGLSKESYLERDSDKQVVASSLFRRLRATNPRISESSFFDESERLVSDAKMQWHHWRDGKVLQDLELTAELQHYEAATCLIDFSRNPLVALWFACRRSSSPNKADDKSGVVVAFAGHTDTCNKISSRDIEKPIAELFFAEKGVLLGGKPYVWAPPQSQNTRITAQQSVFVFGRRAIEIASSHVCYVQNKLDIEKELRECGVTEESLFGGDFDGFARILHSVWRPADIPPDGDSPSGSDGGGPSGSGPNLPSTPPPPAGISPADKSADSYYRIARGKHLIGGKEDLRLAVQYYDKAIEMDVSLSLKDAYYHRSDAKFRSGDLQGALADANEAVKRNPDNIINFWLRGIIKSTNRDWPGAIADYDRVIEINPQYAAAYYNRGIAKRKSGDLPGAIADYDRVIEINPQYAPAYNNRGIANSKLGHHEDAIADYDRAIEINPQDAIAYNNRGNAKDELGDHEDAIADYDRAIDIDSEYATAHYNRGIANYELGHYEDAIADYDRAIEINPQYAKAYHNRGNAKTAQGDKDGTAEADIQKAKEIDSSLKP